MTEGTRDELEHGVTALTDTLIYADDLWSPEFIRQLYVARDGLQKLLDAPEPSCKP